MVLSTAINSGLGMVFWIIAARAYTSREVGLASALVSGVSLVLGVGQLGLPLALPRLLPMSRGRVRRLVSTTYAAAVVASLTAGVGFVVVARATDGLAELFSSTPFVVWFVLSAPFCVIFAVQDFVLCGLHRAWWTPPENLAYSIGRVLLLISLTSLGATGLYIAWTVPSAVAAVAVSWLLYRCVLRPEPLGGPRLDRRLVATMISSDYAGNLAQTAAIRVLPLLIVALLGARASAYFYVVWAVVYALDTVLSNVVTAISVDGAASRDRMVRNVRSALILGVPAVAMAVLALAGVGGTVLATFSDEYRAGTTTLRVLALSLVPRFVILLATASARHDRRPGRVSSLQIVPAVTVITLAAAGVSHGIVWVAAAYTAAQVGAALWSARWLAAWLRPQRQVPLVRDVTC